MRNHNVAIIGDGKMGQAIRQLAVERGWRVTAVVGERESADVGVRAIVEHIRDRRPYVEQHDVLGRRVGRELLERRDVVGDPQASAM